MEETNKDAYSRDSRLRRMARGLRKRFAGPGRIVSEELLRGASSRVGSGAVTLLIIWFQSRR